MTIPTTYLSLHDVTSIKAAALQSFDTPLILFIDTPHGGMQISIYLNPTNVAKVDALADTINAVMKGPEPPEEAAYAARDVHYGHTFGSLLTGLKRPDHA